MRQIPKTFLDLSLTLKLSGIDVKTYSHKIYIENKNLMTENTNIKKTLLNKEVTSSYSEALTAIVFYPD